MTYALLILAMVFVVAGFTALAVSLASSEEVFPVAPRIEQSQDDNARERRPSTLLFAVPRSTEIDRHGAR